MRRAISLRLLALTTLLGFESALAAPPTAIIPNGLGTAVVPLSPQPAGTYYNISGGTTAGSNLFHSFSTFNLGTGDTADFNVSSNIANILTRVTGGPSTIDGTITSTIGAGGPLSSANLFFINPSGVMFTANAQVNLGGSFIVGTASYVEFNDGSMFYGDVNHPIQDAGLTSASVSAFGFLTPMPQPISLAGSLIMMHPGSGMHVIGGNITLDGASLLVPGGNLTLFSTSSPGVVPFSLALPGTGFGSATNPSLGNITLQNGALAAISGNGGGGIVIRGGRLLVSHSGISSVNSGSVVGGPISVDADQLTILNGGYIDTDCYGTGSAGTINVTVKQNLDISGTGSQISANTDSSGNGGLVTVDVAGAVDLADGDIFANVAGFTASGHGGEVDINADSLSMEGAADVSSVTLGAGDAGTVKLCLRSGLTMSGNAAIGADTYTGAQGGDVKISANQISMTGQSAISSNTISASGNGGSVSVTTDSLSMQGSGPGAGVSPAITANTLSSGNAGTVQVTSGSLSLGNGAVISSSSVSFGDGGSVAVSCAQGQLAGQSSISASSDFTNAGSVRITASESLELSSGSSINTSAGENGGDISLQVGRLLYLDNSTIEAFAGFVPLGVGGSPGGPQLGLEGGNINIDPLFFILNNSLISANDLSPGGQNGNITNVSDFFFTNDSLLHATGTIETSPPDLDLGESLTFLPANLVNVENRLRERCAQAVNHEFSTFIVVGRGGTETAPEELRPDFGLSLRPVAVETADRAMH